MQWKRMVTASALLCSCAASPSWAQTWTSTFVGDRGLPGSASQSGDEWTVNGGGADVWDRSDAFQFVHQTVHDDVTVTARVDDLQNTDTFAKAGVMVRASVDAGAAMAILDVRPGGQLEFMVRSNNGDAINFIVSQSAVFPIWLRLSWSKGSVRAWTSNDGGNWAFLGNGVVMLSSFEAGIAVTSHNETELTTAHIGALAAAPEEVPGWNSTDVGIVGLSGNASESNGVWTVSGAGADVWGTDDAFHYVYRPALGQRNSLRVHLTDMQNTSAFAKAGLMIRTSLDPASATVLLDVRPTGDVEFMTRPTDGSNMQYVGGATVTLPIWLELDWISTNSNACCSPVQVTAKVSANGVVWTTVGPTSGVNITLPAGPFSYPIPAGDIYEVGAIVSSHDANAIDVAHFDGLSLFSQGDAPLDVGLTGLVGNTVNDTTVERNPFVLEGAGADIWGLSDSFHFLAFPPGSPVSGGFGGPVHVDIHAANPFAKAGLMIRDGIPVGVSASMVILDVKPDGGIEFMARLCGGCDVTYLGGANVGAHPWMRLLYSGATFSAQVMSDDMSTTVDLGSVTVGMSTFVPGFAVTSHDPTQTAVGVFD